MMKRSKTENWIFWGIPVLFLVGSGVHFLYDMTGKIAFIGIFSPVNQSVWEHTKMSLFPIIAWWGLYYLLKKREHAINKDIWFTSALVSLIVSLMTMPFIFYFYRGAFGLKSLGVDIFILFLAVTLGQLLGYYFYKHSIGMKSGIALLLIVFIVVVYIVFTFFPPHLPIFQDTATGQYGIL